jgi:replication factor C subunit 2/4
MLFYGPPGTGKTSTVLAMCRNLYGPELMKTRVMELNASDERGIAVVREKVKSFAMTTVGASLGGPPFKIIILDEADSLTADAQAALRRTMETYSKMTRFCIICNYVSRIIEPLASRCSKYRFKPLDKPAMLTRLRLVCDGESVTANDDTLNAVLKISNGDMRKAINFLQSASQLYGGVLRPENVVEISGVVPEKYLDSLLAAAKGEGFEEVRKQITLLLMQGFTINVVMEKLSEAIIADATLTDAQKAVGCERLAMADKALIDGADEELQLTNAVEALNRAVRGIHIQAEKEKSLLM